MKRTYLKLLASLLASAGLLTPTHAATAVQDPVLNTVGSGDQAWSYLLLEAEDYVSETNPAEGAGFIAVDNSETVTSFLGNPILRKLTSASKKGALFTQSPSFGLHSDKVTYSVQFSTPGTYYLYFRFTMFENGSNLAHYISEDSFFVPPDFDKDPQFDYALPNGGYVEGCCDLGFLMINDGGTITNHRNGTAEDRAFWEGNFHWNELKTSQFNDPATTGPKSERIKYTVTESMLGHPLNFTISYREGGVTIDAFLFSTHPDLMTAYKQKDVDRIILNSVAVQDPGAVSLSADTATAYPYLLLEAENYVSEVNPDAGFVRVDDTAAITSSQGYPILGTNTTASGKGALFTQSPSFGIHSDKVTYRVQFSTAGTYYLYFRFTMFENGSNLAHYISEDSFFVPPDFGKDPQTDFPLPNGGYVEGCCDLGFLTLKQRGVMENHRNADAEGAPKFWEGNFHWNELKTSQFNDPATTGPKSERIKYVVTESMLNKPLDFTISYREGGVTIDAFLFSQDPDLFEHFNDFDADHTFVNPVTVQHDYDVLGEGETAQPFLILEGEDYDRELSPDKGFIRVDNGELLTSSQGYKILTNNTTASGKGALFTQSPSFGLHSDKVTYQVQFAKPGTYYLYFRFTMFENGSNLAHYISEDSFFVPPDFGKDPQTDFPLPNGGYVEGCCDLGFLMINEKGVITNHRNADLPGEGPYWEGNFHWNLLQTSQFNDPATTGPKSERIKYEVTESMVGKPLEFTISYREGGVTIDAFIFSTDPNLMDEFTNAELDKAILGISLGAELTVTKSGTDIVLSWPTSLTDYVLEYTEVLPAATWTPVTDAPVINGVNNTITVSATTGMRFYRLRKP